MADTRRVGVHRVSGRLFIASLFLVATTAGGAATAMQVTTAAPDAQPTVEPVDETTPPEPTPVPDPVLAAAGDIACDPLFPDYNGGDGTGDECRHKHTSDVLVGLGLDPLRDAVAVLGDGAYQCGSLKSYQQSFDPTWGRMLHITRPAIGNHDYFTSHTSAATDCTSANAGAMGYFDYFGDRAGPRGKGYYSYELGAWHVVVLNSMCAKVGGCTATSPQGLWLQGDLAAHQTACTLAYWHHPLWAGGARAAADMEPIWRLLYDAGVDVVLNGHRHWYERLAPLDPTGVLDPARGIRQFVVGTGGEEFQGIASVTTRSEVFHNKTFGIGKFTLRDTSYDWEFLPEAGAPLINGVQFTDKGTGQCHQASTDVTAPTAPTDLTATVTTDPARVDLSWAAATDDAEVVGYRIFRDGVPIGYRTESDGIGTPVTTFVDTKVAGGATYSYSVSAYDRTGNESPVSPAATATIPGSTVLTFTAVADSRTNKGQPNANFGTVSPIMVDGTPQMRSYVRFNLSGLAGRQVVSAKLRLWVANASPTGGSVHRTDGKAWAETTVTWNNQPGILTTPVATLGSVTAGTSKLVDVTSMVTGDGTLDVALTSTHADNAAYLSREVTNAGRRPALVVTVR